MDYNNKTTTASDRHGRGALQRYGQAVCVLSVVNTIRQPTNQIGSLKNSRVFCRAPPRYKQSMCHVYRIYTTAIFIPDSMYLTNPMYSSSNVTNKQQKDKTKNKTEESQISGDPLIQLKKNYHKSIDTPIN